MSEKTCHIRTHAVIMNSEVYRNVILTYSPDNPNRLPIISDFSTETHSTTSYNGIIIIAPAGYQLPPELSISGTINGPEQFTELINSLAATVPSLISDKTDLIFLPL